MLDLGGHSVVELQPEPLTAHAIDVNQRRGAGTHHALWT